MTPAEIGALAAEHGLFVMGACNPEEYPGQTLVILGAGPEMWSAFSNGAEFADRRPDPLDRWSKRVIQSLSPQSRCLFPSDGPPYAPFIAFALQTGQFFQSPTGMMVHRTAGLLISIRGGVLLPGLHAVSEPAAPPCATCEAKPCIQACPVGALSDQQPYDVPACKAFIREDQDQACMRAGCATRNACPLSQRFARNPAQTEFHMRAFMGVTE